MMVCRQEDFPHKISVNYVNLLNLSSLQGCCTSVRPKIDFYQFTTKDINRCIINKRSTKAMTNLKS